MNRLRKGIAILLAAAMCIPALPMAAKGEEASMGDVPASVGASVEASADEVKFNTGHYEWRVADAAAIEGLQDAFSEKYGDDYEGNPAAMAEAAELMHYAAWEADGGYTIPVEQDAFFPYEVQFTYGGETASKWFATGDATVMVGGHEFRLDVPEGSGDVVTQMSLDVGGDTVVVYPKGKEFTNDEGSQTAPISLLPLEEKEFEVDLKGYTPVELTKVAFAKIFNGGTHALPEDQYVMWRGDPWDSSSNYTVNRVGDTFDLNYDADVTMHTWEMVAGAKDQLEANNIRYLIKVSYTRATEWLKPTIYLENGTRKVPMTEDGRYKVYPSFGENRLEMEISEPEKEGYSVCMELNESVFANPDYDSLRVFLGKCKETELTGEDITAQIWKGNASDTVGGYPIAFDSSRYKYQWVTLVAYKAGKVTGCLPIELSFYNRYSTPYTGLSSAGLFQNHGSKEYVYYDSSYNYSSKDSDGITIVTVTYRLYKEYPVDGSYTKKFSYFKDDAIDNSNVTAYLGKFSTIAAAQAAGAADVKNELFGDGYTANYSNGVMFSIFIGADGPGQMRYCYLIKTEASEHSKDELWLSSSAYANFSGVVAKGESGNFDVPCKIMAGYDSYGENNYYTIFVENQVDGRDVDLSSLALRFSTATGATLYAGEDEKGQPQVSGESFLDFSKGAVQFAVSSANKKNQMNYFVRVLKANDNRPDEELYVNSLEDDENAKTRIEGGVTYSTREVMLDSYHNYQHDILVSNIGVKTMSALKAVLESEELELDEYWTLTGNHDLGGFTTTKIPTQSRYGKLSNLAMVRLRAKAGVESGERPLGKLIFMSGSQTVMELSLTGVIGDPCITTEKIPNPTKYVPYGTMIMNNNKYSWNHVAYKVIAGKLPAGMNLEENGEFYGVPLEAGEFDITVRMISSNSRSSASFPSSERSYHFTVLENTDEYVVQAQDDGYRLTETIDGIYDLTNGAYYIESEGVFGEFFDLYIDGKKMARDTDYWAVEGSTRITIASQSLPKSVGTHTIGVEFRRDNSKGKVKAGAQNYRVTPSGSSQGSSGGSSGGSGYWGNTGGSSTPTTNKPDPGKDGNKPADSTPSVPSSGNTTNPPSVTEPDDGPGLNTSIGKDMIYARLYIVKDGDTLKSLAKKFYGKSSKWKKIYNANKNKIPASKKLKAGMRLQIPAINYTVKKGDTVKSIAKKYFGANSKWKQVYQVNKDVIPASLKLKAGTKLVIPVPVVCRIYAVKAGDTLEKIAKKFYGKSSKWKKIYNANKNKVSASKKLKAGTNLFIPAMTYTVKKGDDIKGIAKKYYGAKGEWRQIYDANRDVIPSSKKLKAGVTLVLPVPVDIG